MRGIYKFTNKINGKSYIGQSVHLEERYNQHRRDHARLNQDTKFYRALRKYGWDNFDYEILAENESLTDGELDILEQKYIQEYDSYYNGYNSTLGGSDSRVARALSFDDIRNIRDELLNSTIQMKEIAQKYNVSESTISSINSGKIWNEPGGGISRQEGFASQQRRRKQRSS